MRGKLTTWLPLLLLGMLGMLAALGRYMELRNDTDAYGPVPDVIEVTSTADRGPGSLRSALFLAMKTDHPVTIALRVPTIDLDVPLPPIAIPDTLRIEGRLQQRTRITNRNDSNGDTALVQLVSDDIALAHVEIAAAGAMAIAVRGSGAVLEDIGVHAAALAVQARNADRLLVTDSLFTGNEDGVRIEGQNGSVFLRNNEFADNEHCNIWIVFSEAPNDASHTIAVHDNRLSGGRESVIVANAVVDLRGNRLTGFGSAGLMLIDATATIRGNRILDSRGIGLHLTGLQGSRVSGNEIGRNDLVGILIIDANGLQVDDNEIYANGYGIATVGRSPVSASLRNNTLVDQSIDGLVSIGDTPLIQGNRALRNRQAGIRILDLQMPDQPLVAASPRHAGNILRDNGNDQVLFGRYTVTSP